MPMILLQAKARIDGTAKKIDVLAYGGGLLRLAGWIGPVLVDLAGLELPEQTPLLVDHLNAIEGVAGHVVAEIAGGRELLARGTILAGTEAGDAVLNLAAGGLQLRASVGVDPVEVKHVRPGDKVTANGQTFTAPAMGLNHVIRGTLMEISLLPAGADSNTRVSVQATKRREGEKTMDGIEDAVEKTAEELRAEATAEASRINGVRKICAGAHPEIEAKALGEGWDKVRTELEIVRGSRGSVHARGESTRAPRAEILGAACLLRMGGSEKLVLASYGEQVTQQARDLHTRHAMDLVQMALKTDDVGLPTSRPEMVRAALSTLSLPIALGSSADRILLASYEASLGPWSRICRPIDLPNFRPHTPLRGNIRGRLEKVGGAGEIKHGSVDETTYANLKAETFARQLGISRQDIINDALGVLADVTGELGREASRSVSDLFAEVLLANAASHFSGGNVNLLTGAGSVLGLPGLTAAVLALRKMKDAQGNDLDIRPSVLLAPPDLEAVARPLLASQEVLAVTAEITPSGNAWTSVAALEIESRLSNTAKWAGASLTAWYLFGPISASPILVGFVNGVKAPTIEALGMTADVNLLAFNWRVYFDYGFALGDPKAAIKNAGA